MNTDNTRSAASLRRSAIVERLRLREEWSALKETANDAEINQKPKNTRAKKQQNIIPAPETYKNTVLRNTATRTDNSKQVGEVLRGVVVLVEVGSESRALPLRAALSALGASVVPAWSQLVTHVVWTQGGCRSVRSKAKVLACSVVSPLWVEACAAERRRLPERIFPVAPRQSDLPSPGTLRRFLKRAEQENIPIHNLLSDSQEGDNVRPMRLRLSSDTDCDTTDTSRDKSKDTSHDSTGKTAPRRTKEPLLSQKPKKSKRKLFTQKEAQILNSDEENGNEKTPAGPKTMQPSRITPRQKKGLAKAERVARLLIGAPSTKATQTNKHTHRTQYKNGPRVILTGMSRKERSDAWQAIRQLNGKVQRYVDKKTTHIILGSCHEPTITSPLTPKTNKTKKSPKTKKSQKTKKTPNRNSPITICNQCNSPGTILDQMQSKNVIVTNCSQEILNGRPILCSCNYNNISGINNLNISTENNDLVFPIELRRSTQSNDRIRGVTQSNDIDNAQSNNVTLLDKENVHSNDLLGTVRGTQSKFTKNSQSNILRNVRGNTQSNDIMFHQKIDVRENTQNNDVMLLHKENVQTNELSPVRDNTQTTNLCPATDNRQRNNKPRTVNALLGAARGCKVVGYEWVKDSLKANRWLHHMGYEVHHLKKISQKASVERLALDKMNTDYAYDVFNGISVKVSTDAEQRDAVIQLLILCGATVHDGGKIITRKFRIGGKTQNDMEIQNGGSVSADIDLTVGLGNGEVCSKWVFDSVAAARVRTTRRYVNRN